MQRLSSGKANQQTVGTSLPPPTNSGKPCGMGTKPFFRIVALCTNKGKVRAQNKCLYGPGSGSFASGVCILPDSVYWIPDSMSVSVAGHPYPDSWLVATAVQIMVRGRKCGGVRRHLQRPRGLQPLERDLLLATAGDDVHKFKESQFTWSVFICVPAAARPRLVFDSTILCTGKI